MHDDIIIIRHNNDDVIMHSCCESMDYKCMVPELNLIPELRKLQGMLFGTLHSLHVLHYIGHKLAHAGREGRQASWRDVLHYIGHKLAHAGREGRQASWRE